MATVPNFASSIEQERRFFFYLTVAMVVTAPPLVGLVATLKG